MPLPELEMEPAVTMSTAHKVQHASWHAHRIGLLPYANPKGGLPPFGNHISARFAT